ncbi:hypothetical protein BKI52_10535 [marine bacterium AO1-C]|nr:hypothetical protein BKI52_10535 [marine bacterium AO1-C]
MANQPLVTSRTTTFSQLLMFLGCLFIGIFLIGYLLGILALMPFFTDLSFKGLLNFLQNPTDNWEGRFALLLLQGVSALVGFIIIPLLYLRYFEARKFASLHERKTSLVPILLALAVVLVVMPFMSAIIHWNANLQLPGFLSEFEKMAKAKEEQLAQLTSFLTNLKTGGEFFFTLVIIAVIPGIGEEIVFRGIIQKKLTHLMNPHVAIWLTGFLFSAFHLQFYGLIPRMLLGVLFGYLYYWSGNLWLSILAHFLNNGFTLLMIYLYKTGVISFDIQKLSYGVVVVLLSLVGSAVLLWLTHKLTYRPSEPVGVAMEYAEENN